MFLLENLKLCVSLAQSCYCKCFLHKCQQNLGTKGQSQMWYFLLKKEGKKWLLKVLIFPFFPSSLSTCHGFSYLILNIASPSAYTSVVWGHCWAKRNADPHYSAHVLPSSCWVMSSDWTGWTSLKLVKSSRESLSICGLWSISMSRNKSIGFNNSISVK